MTQSRFDELVEECNPFVVRALGCSWKACELWVRSLSLDPRFYPRAFVSFSSRHHRARSSESAQDPAKGGLEYFGRASGQARVHAMLSDTDVFYGDMRNHQPVEGAAPGRGWGARPCGGGVPQSCLALCKDVWASAAQDPPGLGRTSRSAMRPDSDSARSLRCAQPAATLEDVLRHARAGDSAQTASAGPSSSNRLHIYLAQARALRPAR